MTLENTVVREDYEGCGAAADDAAEALVELFSGGGEADVDAVVEVGHVDSDLEGGGADDGADGVGAYLVLDLAPFFGEVSGPVGGDLGGSVGVCGDALCALAGVVEDDQLGVGVGVDDGGDELGRGAF